MHALRESLPNTTFQPAGTAANAGHNECWVSSFTSARKDASSSSNGFVITHSILLFTNGETHADTSRGRRYSTDLPALGQDSYRLRRAVSRSQPTRILY